jgi:hypothetical protein
MRYEDRSTWRVSNSPDVIATHSGGDQGKDWSASRRARNVAAALLTSASRIVVA